MVRSTRELSFPDINQEVDRFRPFSDSYRDFFVQFNRERIFTKEPPEDSCGSVAAHLLEGRYLLKSFWYDIDKNVCDKAVAELVKLFGDHLPVGKEDLVVLNETFLPGRLGAHEFVTMVFRNQGNRFLEIVREYRLDEDLATFFAVYLARLFRAGAISHLCEDITYFNWKDWQKGYCPTCGHWPAMAHINLEGENRTLWCLNCGTTWPFGLLECIYCLNDDRERMELIAPHDEHSLQVQACTSCREYIKEIHSGVAVDEFPFDAYFLGTHAMDFFARGQGFVHESILAIEEDNPSAERHIRSHRMRLPWDHKK